MMMMNGHTDRIVNLTHRAADVAARLAKLYEQRRALALDTAEGNKSALRQIAAIDVEAAELVGEQATLLSAVESAEEIDRAQQAARERDERKAHEAAARRTADAVLKLTVEIDAAMDDLRKQFERRATLIRELGKTGAVAGNLIQRFLGKAGPTSAMKAHGLDRHVAIEFVGAGHVQTLAESNSLLRGPLTLPAAPPPQPRYRLPAGQTNELPVADS
jgi:hypothetical protein